MEIRHQEATCSAIDLQGFAQNIPHTTHDKLEHISKSKHLENDESKASGPSRHWVMLQVDVLNLAILAWW